MRVSDFEKFFNHETNYYEISKEDLTKMFQNSKEQKLTEKGAKIVAAMQNNKEKYLNLFTAKILGELLFMAPRSVSGSMKKLISNNYVEKVGQNPVNYSLTIAGDELNLDID